MVDPKEQDRLRKLYEQQRMPGTTMKSAQSSSMNQFLKRKDPKLDALKEKYLSNQTADKQSAFKKTKKEF